MRNFRSRFQAISVNATKFHGLIYIRSFRRKEYCNKIEEEVLVILIEEPKGISVGEKPFVVICSRPCMFEFLAVTYSVDNSWNRFTARYDQ